MELKKLTDWYFCWNRGNKFPILDMDDGYTGNIYLLQVSFYGQLKQNDTRIGDMEIILSLII